VLDLFEHEQGDRRRKMDFELTEEQRAIQKAARDFAKGEFTKELALECELNHVYPRELLRKAGRLGLIALNFPEEYGGQGYGVLEKILVTEELCRADSGLGTSISISTFGSGMVLMFGSDEQKLKYLPGLASGEAICGAAFTEPNHGSDITWLETTGARDGDHWVINGCKMFISNGELANFIIVLCQTDPEARPLHRGMSTIIVETDTPGFKAMDVGPKMGWRMTSTAQLSFDDVRVPMSNLLGQEGKGYYQTMRFFNEGRVGTATLGLGYAQGAFDRALAYAKQRKQFGLRIGDFQAIQHKLADMAIKVETARLLIYEAAWAYDHGKLDDKLVSIAKAHACRVAVEVAEEAVQVYGGYGLLTENEVERIYRDARILEIVEGTREIQKTIIGRALVGKEE
jgi:alkylation response protein AidB-like acyl-CoA dehydrogenase